MATTPITTEMLEWAETESQRRAIEETLANGGSSRAAARKLGQHHSTVQKMLKRIRDKAAAHGYSPANGLQRGIPAPFIAKGHSTLDRVHPDGSREMMLQWTKTRLDDVEYQQELQDAIELFVKSQPKITAPTQQPGLQANDGDIIPWIQIGDAHLGMLAHEAETGANFDLKIAKRELMAAIEMLIDEMPYVERLVVQDMGDFTHYENIAGVTEASGHALDFDGRFPKMIDAYAETMRFIIDKCLTKAKHVDVIVNQGNHSRTNDIWMAVLLREVYDKDRVHVLNNHSKFIGYRMGNTFVMSHHSDKCKPAKLAHVMATDFAQDWGESKYRYIDIGHIHHNMVLKEHPGVTVESWNQLANKDEWAASAGYRARQSISIVYRSKTYGEVGRRMLPIDAVRDRIQQAHEDRGETAPYRPKQQRAYTV